MKLSVRSKVANGLVICLLIPRVASTAVELFEAPDEGLNAFAADDEFILGAENRGFAVMEFEGRPSGDPAARPGGGTARDDQCDPSANPGGCAPPHPGGDPSGHTGGPPPHAGPDPSGFDPSACLPGPDKPTEPTLIITAPKTLVTAECDPSGGGVDPSGHWDPSGCSQLGASDFFEISMDPAPQSEQIYYFTSTDPTEARLVTEAVVLGDHSCFPTAIWVEGQNDGVVDGDQKFAIEVLDEQQQFIDRINGINLDDDNYKAIALEIREPARQKDGSYLFLVNIENSSESPVEGNNLVISVTPKLAIKGYLLGARRGFNADASLKPHELVFRNVSLEGGEVLTIDVQVVSRGSGPQQQKIFARFLKPESGLENTEEESIPPPSP